MDSDRGHFVNKHLMTVAVSLFCFHSDNSQNFGRRRNFGGNKSENGAKYKIPKASRTNGGCSDSRKAVSM